jgi:hypothetical protein
MNDLFLCIETTIVQGAKRQQHNVEFDAHRLHAYLKSEREEESLYSK